MKTKLILLTAVLAVATAQSASAPLWEGDHPGSFMRRQTDPAHAAMILGFRQQDADSGKLSNAQKAELEQDKKEYNAYIDWSNRRAKK